MNADADAADRSRDAARGAVRDVDPTRLRETIDERIAAGSAMPGALTVLTAQTVGSPDRSAAERLAAGVQLIYEGLRLTRHLVDGDPWRDEGTADRADIEVLAADVMVARGFRLLAGTTAAECAVETVRRFGRERTDEQAGRDSEEPSLEESVFELAVVAGAAVTGSEAPEPLRQYAAGLAHAEGRPLPPAEAGFPRDPESVLGRLVPENEVAAPAGSANRND
jgi:hypothetical protein